jgi:hypothetical protein
VHTIFRTSSLSWWVVGCCCCSTMFSSTAMLVSLLRTLLTELFSVSTVSVASPSSSFSGTTSYSSLQLCSFLHHFLLRMNSLCRCVILIKIMTTYIICITVPSSYFIHIIDVRSSWFSFSCLCQASSWWYPWCLAWHNASSCGAWLRTCPAAIPAGTSVGFSALLSYESWCKLILAWALSCRESCLSTVLAAIPLAWYMLVSFSL